MYMSFYYVVCSNDRLPSEREIRWKERVSDTSWSGSGYWTHKMDSFVGTSGTNRVIVLTGAAYIAQMQCLSIIMCVCLCVCVCVCVCLNLGSIVISYPFHLFDSVALICLVLYLRKTYLSNICILYCLFSLNSVPFNSVCFDLL